MKELVYVKYVIILVQHAITTMIAQVATNPQIDIYIIMSVFIIQDIMIMGQLILSHFQVLYLFVQNVHKSIRNLNLLLDSYLLSNV